MKRLDELNVGDIIYLYGIASLSNGEFVIDKELEITNINKHFKLVTGRETQSTISANHIIKANEGTVYRNLVWLTENNKELAMKLLTDFFDRKIEIAQNSINGFENKKHLLEKHFKEV